MAETHDKRTETHACDLIRQAAIDEIKALYEWHDMPTEERMIQHFKVLPSAQQWIPTSERLPKVREWVLCQCRAGIMDVLLLTEDGSWNKNYPHVEYMSGFVIAWMPLPDSWEGEEKHGTSRAVLSQKPVR